MVEATVSARLKATGVEETKAAMQDMRASVLNVSTAKLSDAKATRELARDASVKSSKCISNANLEGATSSY